MRARRSWAAAVATLGALAFSTSAGAATQIGETFTPNLTDGNVTEIQSGSPGNQYAAPFPGVITSWSFQASAVPPTQLKFKLARHVAGDDFRILAEEGPHDPTAGMLNTYPAQIAVQAGDLIGLRFGGTGHGTRSAPGYTIHHTSGDVLPGTATTFDESAGFQLDVSAILEPDCDSDGFGDETQDPDTSSCNPTAEPGPKPDGTLTIDANKGKVEKGRKVTLTGQLDVAANEACEPGRAVQIQRRLKSQDDSKFATFKTVNTDATGNYSTKVKVKKTYFYRAVVGETDACDDETSSSQKVRVQKKKAAQEA